MTKTTRALLVVLAVIASTATTGCLGFGAGCGPLRALIGTC